MDYNYLAELLFPDVRETPEDMEKRYPPRELPEGAKVTRFAPSPTGFVHFGGLFPSTVGDRLAHQSGGVFYLRIEDTDAKREVPGAAEALIRTLETYGINFDEGAILGDDGKICDKGNYGPYKQSLRGPIYHVYAKQLVKEGKAYPCFSTEEELEELQQINKKEEIKNTDWEAVAAQRKAEMLARRNFTIEEVEANLKAGMPFVLRILADGDPEKKIKFTDLVKGNMEVTENDEDFVLLKSDGIPTYHFAHAVDDHLMGTTHVIRGEEWLPSLPKHIQLFRYLGFRLPKYMHIAQIMRLDENGNKKKLSKRDMGANLSDYSRLGYAPECVCEYIMTLLNSNFEEWRRANQTAPLDDFPFSTKKMSVSGSLFDMDKLHDVSKNVISRMSAEDVYDSVAKWSADNDPEFHELFVRDPEMTKQFLAIGRGGKKPRKDLALWSETKAYMDFMFDELFQPDYSGMPERAKADAKAILTEYQDVYDAQDEMTVWFDKVKALAERHGFAPETKLYKKNPEQYKGPVGDISMVLRVAICGRTNAPDLYSVMQLMPTEKIKARLAAACEAL